MEREIEEIKKELLGLIAPTDELSEFCLQNYVFDNAVELGKKIDIIYSELEEHCGELILYQMRDESIDNRCGFISEPNLIVSENNKNLEIALKQDKIAVAEYLPENNVNLKTGDGKKIMVGEWFWKRPNYSFDEFNIGFDDLEGLQINPEEFNLGCRYKNIKGDRKNRLIIGNQNVAKIIKPNTNYSEDGDMRNYISFINALYEKEKAKQKIEQVRQIPDYQNKISESYKSGTLTELVLI